MSWFDVALQNYYANKRANDEQISQGVSGLVSGLGDAIGQYRQNQQANAIGSQMLNTAAPPRAALVATPGGKALPAGVSTAGTAPARFTGGRQGLAAAIEMQRMQQAQSAAGFENALKQAQTGEALARTKAIPFDTQAHQMTAQAAAQRPVTAQNKAIQQEEDKNAYTIPRLAKEFEDVYGFGKGREGEASRMAFQAATTGQYARGKVVTDNGGTQYWQGDPNGPLVSVSPSTIGYKGTATVGGAGVIPEEEAKPYGPAEAMNSFMDRYNKIIAAGGRLVGPAPAQGTRQPVVTPPGQAQPAGQQPIQVSTKAEADALPPGTIFIDPYGVPHRR